MSINHQKLKANMAYQGCTVLLTSTSMVHGIPKYQKLLGRLQLTTEDTKFLI